MKKFQTSLPKEDASDPKKIETAFKKFCKDLKLKENRFVSNKICVSLMKYFSITFDDMTNNDLHTYLFYSAITWVEQQMLPRVYWVKCQNLCHGECQLKRCAKN